MLISYMSAQKPQKTQEAIREGAWLVSVMQQAQIKNTDLVDRLGLNTENLVSQWRTGHRAMTDLQMLQVGRILGVDVYSIRPILSLYSDALAGRSLLAGLSSDQISDVVRYVGLLRGSKASGEVSV